MFEKPETTYNSDLKERMSIARKVARRFIENARTKQKKYYDSKAKASRLDIGDNAFIIILAHKGKHKIADKYESELYLRTDQPNDGRSFLTWRKNVTRLDNRRLFLNC
ncbi:hypothetical protein DPMN_045319 [Dreissena polymorpha]|uniref:Uncharacterized protein n=1 Tax=Dreissena polymorpha TaxID=45954 RepID=A0A9D4D613_DREPO|nr:hypothetical protein DPMN_045319 [Dreissena polymorpha]